MLYNDCTYRGDRDVMDVRLGGQVLIHQPMTKVSTLKHVHIKDTYTRTHRSSKYTYTRTHRSSKYSEARTNHSRIDKHAHIRARIQLHTIQI